jgi:hypothetical protein
MATSIIVAHDTRCPEAMGPSLSAEKGVRDAPYARPHSCLPGGWTRGPVVNVEVSVPPHAYEPTMLPGSPRALCAVCRDPHAEEMK